MNENLLNRVKQPNPKRKHMAVHEFLPFTLTLQELREVVEANPNHPRSAALKAFCEEHQNLLPPDAILTADKTVIRAILTEKGT